MISSSAIKPKHQPVLSKLAQDRKDQLYVTLRKHPVLDPVIAIVDGYEQNIFVPHQVFKFRDEDKYIVITKAKPDETDSLGVAKRVAVHVVTLNTMESLDIQDTLSRQYRYDRGTYYFTENEREIKWIDTAHNKLLASVARQADRIDEKIHGLQELKTANVPQQILDQFGILGAPQQEIAYDERLVSAVIGNNATEIHRLIREENVNPNSTDAFGNPVLLMAARLGFLLAAQALVENGADLEIRENITGDYKTALLVATQQYIDEDNTAHFLLLRYLVEHGADTNACDINGRTSLALLCRSNNPILAELLIAHGANPSQTDLWDTRPVEAMFELVRHRNTAVRTLLAHYHMHKDAENWAEHWSYDEKNAGYNIQFKQRLPVNDIIRVWNAIANKIKSQQVTDDLGFLADDGPGELKCIMTFPVKQIHRAQVDIPDAKHHAIQEMRGDQHGITITLKDEYKKDLLVAKKLQEIFTELKIKSASAADVKVSENSAAMFAPPGLSVNDKPVLPQYKKTR